MWERTIYRKSQVLECIRIGEADKSTTIAYLSRQEFEKFQIKVPEPGEEQQKIGSCLSSIDELITSQAAKVEALKEHKKALMQRLFPSSNEK